MSLINQMLQDLEARAQDPARRDPLPAAVRPAPSRAVARRSVWIFAMLAISGSAATGWVAWDRLHRPPAAPGLTFSPELSLKFEEALMAGLHATDAAENAPPAMPAPQERETGPAEEPTFRFPAAVPERAEAGRPATAAGPASTSLNLAATLSAPPVTEDRPRQREQAAAPTPRQQAEAEYRRGLTHAQQGRPNDAIAAFDRALQLDQTYVPARQSLAAQLIEARKTDEAILRLQEGLDANRANGSLAMMLARLQIDRGETKAAIDTLARSLPYDRERADYHAFMAALLQKESRHREAIDYFLNALRKSPQNAAWWMGLGVSLQAESRAGEARDAYARAQSIGGLSADLQSFVQQRLDQVSR